MIKEIGFILFIISVWMYFMHGGVIIQLMHNAYNLATAAFTVAAAFSAAYYLYKNPDQFHLVVDMLRGDSKGDSRLTLGSNEKRNVTQLMKKRVAADQQWKCGHCKNVLDETYEVDHKLALYKGGTNDRNNLIALCRGCHGKKTVNERLGS